MNTFTIALPDEQTQTLQQQAQCAGVALEEWLRRLVEDRLSPISSDDKPRSDKIDTILRLLRRTANSPTVSEPF